MPRQSPADAIVENAASLVTRRRLPIGAEVLAPDSVHFRVWAPAAESVDVLMEGMSGPVPLGKEPDGYFSGFVEARAGTRYRFRLDGSGPGYPDPSSRFQPDGPHGSSEVIDPTDFTWTDGAWPGVRLNGQILLQLHIGTFTPEGTWAAATDQLAELASLGVSVIEVMPIADFQGTFGWGYDGVDLYTPARLYGRPNDFRRFVDTAHDLGVGVILDVVYNHLGPSGNYLRSFAPAYFTDQYENEWGDAINFDGPAAGPVREFFIENAGYWIDEFHLDGLRLDATQQIFDRSETHILSEITARARRRSRGRSTIVIAENEPQDSRLVRPVAEGGYGLDALWNDDLHHSAMVALTGRGEAYYSDTSGVPQELISAAKYGYLFQGQYYAWQRQARGTPSRDIAPLHFVSYLQNHDQVANSALGLRGHRLTSPSRWRAMTAFLLLIPSTPLLFQGQEFSSSTPFLYFADLEPDLAEAVRQGRGKFLEQFSTIIAFRAASTLADPGDPGTFMQCKLDFAERTTNRSTYDLHRDLIGLRRSRQAFREQRRVDGAVLSAHAFMLRFSGDAPIEDRVLLVNLGGDVIRRSFAEPLLAPPVDRRWEIEWTSEDPRYGGVGIAGLWQRDSWVIPGDSAIVLAPVPRPRHAPNDPKGAPPL